MQLSDFAKAQPEKLKFVDDDGDWIKVGPASSVGLANRNGFVVELETAYDLVFLTQPQVDELRAYLDQHFG